MIRLPPRSTRTDTSFPTRRSSELPVSDHATGCLDAGYREALVDALQKLEILRQPHPQGAQILLGLPWREFDHECPLRGRLRLHEIGDVHHVAGFEIARVREAERGEQLACRRALR